MSEREPWMPSDEATWEEYRVAYSLEASSGSLPVMSREKRAHSAGMAAVARLAVASYQRWSNGQLPPAVVCVHDGERRGLCAVCEMHIKADRDKAVADALASSAARWVAEQGGSIDRLTHLDSRIREWADATFPSATIASHLRHMRKEIDEAEADPRDVSEWADLLIMTLYGAALGMHTFGELIAATEAKHEVNVKRQWGPPDEHGVVEHVRATPAQAPPK